MARARKVFFRRRKVCKFCADKIDYICVSRNHAPELGITGQYCPDIDTLPIDYETARRGIDILSKLKGASE